MTEWAKADQHLRTGVTFPGSGPKLAGLNPGVWSCSTDNGPALVARARGGAACRQSPRWVKGFVKFVTNANCYWYQP